MFRKSSYCRDLNCVEVDVEMTEIGFRKSSRCAMEQCVEVGAGFRTASRCESHTCVEVGRPDGVPVFVRDSKEPAGSPMLAVSPEGWTAFLSMIKS